MSNKIIALQYIRGFASISVLFTHVLQKLDIKASLGKEEYYLSGQYGVDIFFILSGFVIYYTLKPKVNWLEFGIKRIFRIFPAYLTVLSIYFIYKYFLNNQTYPPLQIIQNLLMLPFADSIGYKSLIVGQAWSTVYEMYFYLSMILVLLITKRKHFILPFLIGAFAVSIVAKKIIGVSFDLFPFLYSLSASVHIFWFITGIIIAILYANFSNNVFEIILSRNLVSRILFLIIQIGCFLVLLLKYDYFLAYFMTTICFVAWLFFNNIYKKDESSVSRFFIYLGDISFSIYLIHLIIIQFFIEIVGIDSFFLLLGLTLLFTLVLAHLIYKHIEKPFIDYAKTLTKIHNESYTHSRRSS